MLFIVLAAVIFAGPGAATAAVYGILDEVPYVGSGRYDLGTITVRAPADSLSDEDVLIVSLPQDFEIPEADVLKMDYSEYAVPDWATGAVLIVPKSYDGNVNALYPIADKLKMEVYGEGNAVRIYFEPEAIASSFQDYFFYLYLLDIRVPSGINGDISVTFTANGGWGDGGQQVAKISGSDHGTVAISAGEAAAFTESATVKLTFTESQAGALVSGGYVKLRLPEGFAWEKPSASYKAEYAQGDIPGLKLEVSGDGRDFTVSASSGGSTRTSVFSAELELTVSDPDKAALGSVYAALSTGGGVRLSKTESLKLAVLEEKKAPEPEEKPAEEGAEANVSVFVIDSASYTVNGEVKILDAPPYIKNDRTYLPVRYAAYASGVADGDIIWNEAEQTVTLRKGAAEVKLTIGSTEMTANGVSVQMDTAPEIYQSRTMLPASWVANAFGAEVQWEANSRAVTISY
jgi:hypothetical protein